MKRIQHLPCIILILLYNIHFGWSSMYLAMSHMEDLLDAEKAMITGLEDYIISEEKKLLELKLKINEYQKEYTDCKNNSNSYLFNPINAYLLTKHLSSDWNDVEKLIKDNENGKIIQNVVNTTNGIKFPTTEDLNGAANALIRLQNVYNLEAEDVASGLLNTIKFDKELNANDCFLIGKSAYNEKNYKRTVHWMKVALEKYPLEEKENLMPYVTKASILGYLAFAIYKEGDVRTALKLTKELLELEPDNQTAQMNTGFYEMEINELDEKKTTISEEVNAPEVQSSPKDFLDLDFIERYEILCRGEEKPSPSEQKNLKCGYIHNNNPYLKIGPIKIEEILMDPLILIFHDVLYDSEIESIKKVSKAKLDRATVFNDNAPKIRISKTAWIHHGTDPIVDRITRRAGYMSRLNMQSAEALQICNYGIGGHYEPHVDYSEDLKAFEADRTATILFYLSDVQQGGATVFTELKRAVWPKKGSAVFWYNLYASGRGNPRTRHASCPVLTGSKWVANLWIHETGQVCFV